MTGWRYGDHFGSGMGGTAAAFLKHKLQECEVTYAELAKRLKKHGFKAESENSINGQA